jgi:glycosyltransferase involved in cell wall biosynthesis
MVVVHLMSSTFFGGPERQALGLAINLPDTYRTVFLLFAENGKCQPFVNEINCHGMQAVVLQKNAPQYRATIIELADQFRWLKADVVCCHGYKADLLGLAAGRLAGVVVLSVSRGWAAAPLKVRVNEMLDKFSLRWMDGVVCVSDGQATKVRRTGISPRRVHVIRNAIQIERFAKIDSAYHELLHGYFPKPPGRIVGAAGRLSPEKGFGVLLQAAELVLQADPHAGFVMFGEGPLRDVMARQIVARGLQDSFILAGFRSDLDCFIPHFDVLALPSFTEGLPNVVLEAFAAAVPVVATAVGGTSEVVENGVNGFLVPPGDPQGLARGIIAVFQNADEGKTLGQRGRQRVREEFTFEAQALQYHRLFTSLMQKCGKASLS